MSMIRSATLLAAALVAAAFEDPIPLQPGFPVSVGSSFRGSPALADIDGDGLDDIVAADQNGNVHVWRHDGSYLPGWPRSAGGGAILGHPSVGDLDADGHPEVVVTTFGVPLVVAFHHTGELVAGYPYNASALPNDHFQGGPALANLDADPGLEIVAVTSLGRAVALDSPGAGLLPGWPKNLGPFVFGGPVLMDLDGLGLPEILIRGTGVLYALSVQGENRPGWPRALFSGFPAPSMAVPAVADLDGDSTAEVVAIHASGLSIFAANGLLEREISSPGFQHSGEGGMALGDLTGDSALEIAVAADGGLLYLLNAGPTILPGWPVILDGEAAWAPIIADLNGDGQQEIIAATDAGTVRILRPDGTDLFPFATTVPGGIGAAPAVGDLDGDGTPELVVGTFSGALYVFDFPGPWDPFWAEWPQAQGDARRTGGHRSMADLADADGDSDPDIFDCAPADPLIHHRAEDLCNGLDDDCSGAPDDSDKDLDGFELCNGDCDDSSGVTYPGAPQICDGINNDCRKPAWPAVPEEEADDDADSWRICEGDCDDTRNAVRPGGTQVCDGLNNDCTHPVWPALTGTNDGDDDGDAASECAGDCDDTSAAIYGGASQICGDGINNDCLHPDWPVDATDTDDDGDGMSDCLGDCNDADATVRPGAPELCDGKDNDCNASIPAVENDLDADGWLICQGDCDDTRSTVRPGGTQICDGLNNDCLHASWPALAGTNETDDDGDGKSECAGDCDDSRAVVYRGAPQICGDGINNDCQHPAWPSDPTDIDDDGDGISDCLGDCNDADPTVRPGAPEICDGKDNDCNASIPTVEGDLDADSFRICQGDCDDTRSSVRPGGTQVCDGLNNNCLHAAWPALDGTNERDDDSDGTSECAGDCDDSRATVYQGAPQVCGDGINNDCLHPAWPTDPTDLDQDADGLRGCDGDCDDARASVHPGAPEICDDRDNDCDGSLGLDERDADADGYALCEGDCDDTRSTVRPGGAQICGDGLNNNCAYPLWPSTAGTNEADDDVDGFVECGMPADCDDTRAAVYPGAPQLCGDGLNNNCLDPSWPASSTDRDADNDGFFTCGAILDCDDTRSLVHPGAPEVCDGVNNNCLDPTWPALPAAERDLDGDGWSSCQFDCDDTRSMVLPGGTQICDGLNNNCSHPTWPSLTGTNEGDDDGDSFVECGGDCDDTRGLVFPGATQVCDGVNNDCAAPGWPSPAGTVDADDDADGWSPCEGDCDTARISVFPGAPQICGDGLNNDCLHSSWPVDLTEIDNDGDGQAECPAVADCDDGNPAVFTFAPQVCGDGLNNDCRHPMWPLLSGTNESDDDGDGFAECAAVPDCSDLDGAAWTTPGEAGALLAWYNMGLNLTELTWSAPTSPGAASVTYDVLRSDVPWEFLAGTSCVATNVAAQTAPDTTQSDPSTGVWFYLIRTENGCPGAAGRGVLGRDSSGGEIVGRSCP